MTSDGILWREGYSSKLRVCISTGSSTLILTSSNLDDRFFRQDKEDISIREAIELRIHAWPDRKNPNKVLGDLNAVAMRTMDRVFRLFTPYTEAEMARLNGFEDESTKPMEPDKREYLRSQTS